ncbi:MAG: hypothetical protein V4722_24290 [Bacteroidota bacterium]
MKHVFISTAFILFIGNIHAQVKIGGTPEAPHPSAVLEVDGGNTKGLLLPRMRKQDILAMVDPAEGLTVYATDEQATYLRRVSNWVKLSASGDAFSLPYTGTFSAPGSVLSLSQLTGAGAVAKFGVLGFGYGNTLEALNESRGFTSYAGLFQLTDPWARAAAIKAEVNPNTFDIDNVAQYSKCAAIHAVNTGRGGYVARFEANNTDGIATAIHATVRGGGDGLRIEANQGRGHAIWAQGNDNDDPAMYVYKHLATTSPVARFATTSDNSNRSVIELNNLGTGYTIDMLQGGTNAMRINGTNPQIMFNNAHQQKGFVQLNGNDFRLGTVSDNTDGNIVFRSGGADRVFINSDGQLLVGGATPPAGSYKVAVKGSIAASAFTVIATNNWPDYVFQKSYKLKSLEETEAFINANHHLPNIPAAAEVEKNGFELGDMQKRMMEKIEELTLHLIEANKRQAEANQRIASLEASLKSITQK